MGRGGKGCSEEIEGAVYMINFCHVYRIGKIQRAYNYEYRNGFLLPPKTGASFKPKWLNNGKIKIR